MIVAVKTNSKKKLIIKVVAFSSLVIMFLFYYMHMSEEFSKNEKVDEAKKIEVNKAKETKEKSKKLERIIYTEIETAVDLIGQSQVIDLKVVSNRALIVVELGTNLDALKVRYGTTALIKRDIDDIKIAIDLKYIIESKYNE